MEEIKYSVLMSVYGKDKPEYLKESIDSMLNQTVKPDEIVLVKDGPLTDALEKVLHIFENKSVLNIIELKENVGLGKALSIGLLSCKNEIVARMDADDISEVKRCEEQYKRLTSENISVVGTSVAEFIDKKNNIVAYKDMSVEHKDIIKKMKYRNAINHPTVMFKKSAVLSSGNYQDCFLNEDYYLWIRMILKGHRFMNIEEPLVRMRISNETYLRRGGWKYFITQKRLFDFMVEEKFIGHLEYVYNNVIRFITRLLIPNRIRKVLYFNLLRRKKKKGSNLI